MNELENDRTNLSIEGLSLRKHRRHLVANVHVEQNWLNSIEMFRFRKIRIVEGSAGAIGQTNGAHFV